MSASTVQGQDEGLWIRSPKKDVDRHCSTLGRALFPVTPADDSSAALERIALCPTVRLVVSDLHVRGLNRAPLIERLRRVLPFGVVAVQSGVVAQYPEVRRWMDVELPSVLPAAGDPEFGERVTKKLHEALAISARIEKEAVRRIGLSPDDETIPVARVDARVWTLGEVVRNGRASAALDHLAALDVAGQAALIAARYHAMKGRLQEHRVVYLGHGSYTYPELLSKMSDPRDPIGDQFRASEIRALQFQLEVIHRRLADLLTPEPLSHRVKALALP